MLYLTSCTELASSFATFTRTGQIGSQDPLSAVAHTVRALRAHEAAADAAAAAVSCTNKAAKRVKHTHQQTCHSSCGSVNSPLKNISHQNKYKTAANSAENPPIIIESPPVVVVASPAGADENVSPSSPLLTLNQRAVSAVTECSFTTVAADQQHGVQTKDRISQHPTTTCGEYMFGVERAWDKSIW